jgi:hypothetical protein
MAYRNPVIFRARTSTTSECNLAKRFNSSCKLKRLHKGVLNVAPATVNVKVKLIQRPVLAGGRELRQESRGG